MRGPLEGWFPQERTASAKLPVCLGCSRDCGGKCWLEQSEREGEKQELGSERPWGSSPPGLWSTGETRSQGKALSRVRPWFPG